MCAIRHTILIVTLKNINAYIVVRALMFVMCAIRHTVPRAILKDINAYIVVSALKAVK